jgi:hypothetical protein
MVIYSPREAILAAAHLFVNPATFVIPSRLPTQWAGEEPLLSLSRGRTPGQDAKDSSSARRRRAPGSE